MAPMPIPTVLVILAEGFEEIEAVTPIDILRRAGAEVTVACLGDGIHVTGRSRLTLHADVTLSAVAASRFDCVLLPGGPGVARLRADSRVPALIGRQAEGPGLIAAICAAPTVLMDAGILENRRYTSHPSVASEMPDSIASERVVVDASVITSRGAGTAVDFGLMIVEKLFSHEKAAEIARSVCA